MNELIQYLKDHFIPFSHISDRVVEIGCETYELSFPNESNSFFDRDFHWDTAYTECDNYIYSFGGVWYWLKKGSENDVKLNKVLYLSEPEIEEDFRESAFLGVHGNMQLLDGMHSYDEWCIKAKWLSITVLGICEKGHLSGAFKFQEACQKYGIKPVFGMEVPVLDEERDIRFTIKVYARDEDGWRILLELNRLCNVIHKEYCTLNEFVSLAKSESYKEHTFTVADPKTVECQYLLDYVLGKDEMYVQFDTVEYEQDDRDKWYLENLKMFYSKKCRFIAICDAYYLEPEYAYIREKINSILKITNYKSSNQYFKNFQEYFLEMQALFGNDDSMFDLWDDAIGNLRYVSENCNFVIDSKSRHLPWYIMTEEEKKRWRTNDEMFVDLIYEGLENHPELIEEYGEEAVFARIDEEIDVIRFGGVVDYFLILRDIVNWARSQNILVGPGRGSCAGSAVVYLLGLTKVNPLKYELFFSRFLNKGRIQKSLPDIDTDFPTNRRQEVKRYMEERFGTKQVCAVGTYTTLQLKAAINDMGDKYGVAIPERKRISKMLGEEKEKTVEDLFRTALKKAEFRAFMRKNTEMFNDLFVILGAPKARSIHACAEMIFPQDRTMFEWSPLRLESDTNQMVCEWEGGELDHAGFLKEDILGLNQLDKIHDILELIKQNTGTAIDPYKDIPLNEPEVMKYFGNGWNGDVFQFTAKGMNGYAQIMKPNSVEELSACTALYRPGPLENGIHYSYVKRKNGNEEVEYLTGTESFLKDTYGLLLYQENVMQASITLAGFTSMEADDLRKAMGKKKADVMAELKAKFVDGYISKWGVTKEYAEDYFSMMEEFAKYSFNKAHAVSYSIISYICQWLKVHYPMEFWSVTFTWAKMDEYPLYINEIEKTGNIGIKTVNINHSRSHIVSDKETNSMYWSLNSVKQIGEQALNQLNEERDKNGEYFSLEEFLDRHNFKNSKVTKSAIENLIYCGAFDELEHVEHPSERYFLLDIYRTKCKVKVDKSKDKLSLGYDKGKHEEDWWWMLMQRNLCGFGEFDHETLSLHLDKCTPYFSPSKLQEYNGYGYSDVKVGGYVMEVEEKKTKNGFMGFIKLDCNYDFVHVVVGCELYEEMSEYFKNSKDCLLYLTGYPTYSKFDDCNIIQITRRSQFVRLKLD